MRRKRAWYECVLYPLVILWEKGGNWDALSFPWKKWKLAVINKVHFFSYLSQNCLNWHFKIKLNMFFFCAILHQTKVNDTNPALKLSIKKCATFFFYWISTANWACSVKEGTDGLAAVWQCLCNNSIMHNNKWKNLKLDHVACFVLH